MCRRDLGNLLFQNYRTIALEKLEKFIMFLATQVIQTKVRAPERHLVCFLDSAVQGDHFWVVAFEGIDKERISCVTWSGWLSAPEYMISQRVCAVV